MKKVLRFILLFLLFLCILGCPSKKQFTNNRYYCDTIILVDTVRDEIYIQLLKQYIQQLEDSITKINTTIPYETYINARKIEKIKYYIDICEKNSNNKKYFYGWIKRTMSEE